MPFDGREHALDYRVSKADEVINLLYSPTKWCKGEFRTRDGRHCIRGAIGAVGDAAFLEPIVLTAIREVTGPRYRSIEL